MLNEDHPFVIWWMSKSGWHQDGEEWRATLDCDGGNIAKASWNAAVHALSDAEDVTDLLITEPF